MNAFLWTVNHPILNSYYYSKTRNNICKMWPLGFVSDRYLSVSYPPEFTQHWTNRSCPRNCRNNPQPETSKAAGMWPTRSSTSATTTILYTICHLLALPLGRVANDTAGNPNTAQQVHKQHPGSITFSSQFSSNTFCAINKSHHIPRAWAHGQSVLSVWYHLTCSRVVCLRP